MRFFIKLSYNGTYYHGWQIQKGAISIEETLEKALSLLLNKSINVVGAGRTDTGVHAREMFAHFDYIDPFSCSYLTKRLNAFLGHYIKIWDIFPVKEHIHARFDAIARTYQYTISLGKDPFGKNFTWQWLSNDLDIEKMNKASSFLLNYDDFKSFVKGDTSLSSLCKIYYAFWIGSPHNLCFYIKANRFLRSMVRNLVGTLIEVGRGKMTLDEFVDVIKAKDRKRAGMCAPAQGLFLMKIDYPEDIYL